MKKKVLKRNERLTPLLAISISRKCDAILSTLDLLLEQISNYPKTFAESIENLYKVSEELSDVCKKKKRHSEGNDE